MVQTRLTALALVALLSVSCSGDGRDMKWSKIIVDGHITGVRGVDGTDSEKYLGVFRDSVYVSPSGREFVSGSVPGVASALISSQPRMAYLKEVVGWSPCFMQRDGDNREIGIWVAGLLKAGAEKTFGTKVDVSIVNSGGIRVDMPDGVILLDDIVSMFPFRNCLVLVKLRGRDLRKVISQMDSSYRFKYMGGEDLGDDKVYKVASLDFLLDGGDGMWLARNALEVRTSSVLVRDCILECVRERYAAGLDIFGKPVGRTVTE